MGNKPNNTNILRCRVFDVRDPFEIAGSLGQVFSNGGQSLNNLVARVICEKTFVVILFLANMNAS